MGINTEQWRARIGTYNGGRGHRVCRAHQNHYVNSVSWTTGEIMSTIPLCIQHGVGFLSLWIILCFLGLWLNKFQSFHCKSNYCKNIRGSVSIRMCISLMTAASVLLHFLLIMAGDVELNPGPGMGNLRKTLKK